MKIYFSSASSRIAVILMVFIRKLGFSYNKETKLLVHGFGDNGQITRLLKVKDQYLIGFDYNIIVVDWEKGASGPNYLAASSNVVITGQKMADFIRESNINASTVHCIGHSLGAHVCGFAGKSIKLNRISGLDPAGPFFSGKPRNERLDKSDADFVDNIHTDYWYGIQEAIGHQDFYPNGGSFQSGCGPLDGLWGRRSFDDFANILKISVRLDLTFDPIDLVACNHMRVPLYFAESINSDCRFSSTPCANYDDFKAGRCSCSSSLGCAPMGDHANPNFPNGKYFLDTNRIDQYCIQ
ncbi:unnamed protein product [Brachionus calyciflorus]|uniref:Lipase domain-containing protein n=1 Tax=Brachionus calyciflorus TaxID=104777 RepID=A0A814EFW4_9BILA|nr:unnamed protein product [Brachionus calyciflorus]